MRTEKQMSSNHAIAAGKPHRPASVTLVALGVLTIASLRLIRLVLAVLDWDFIGTLPGISPVYLVLSGLLWAVVVFQPGGGCGMDDLGRLD